MNDVIIATTRGDAEARDAVEEHHAQLSGALRQLVAELVASGGDRATRDRLVAYERRTDAMYHINQSRNDNRLEIARLRAEVASAKRRPDHPQRDEDDDLAPWGRKKDGTPYTHEEFKKSLNEAIRDIWGLPPVNPNSYMPWEKRPDPDDSPIRARSKIGRG